MGLTRFTVIDPTDTSVGYCHIVPTGTKKPTPESPPAPSLCERGGEKAALPPDALAPHLFAREGAGGEFFLKTTVLPPKEGERLGCSIYRILRFRAITAAKTTTNLSKFAEMWYFLPFLRIKVVYNCSNFLP